MDHSISLLQIWISFPQTPLCPDEYIQTISREDRMEATLTGYLGPTLEAKNNSKTRT